MPAAGNLGASKQFEGGGGGRPFGGAVLGVTDPHELAYQDDHAWRAAVFNNPLLVTATRGELERFYKFAPPLSRGMLVPDGYPLHESGMLGAATNIFPRIIAVAPGTKGAAVLTWTNPTVNGTAWSEDIKAAYPILRNIPPTQRATLAELLADKLTTVALRDPKGTPSCWYSGRYGMYFGYAPDRLFDKLFHAGKVFSDPTSGYIQANYHAWLEPSWRESLRNMAEAVAVAFAFAYGAAALGANGSAGAGAGASTGSVAPTTVATATPASTGTATAIDTGATASVGAPVAPISSAASGAGAAGAAAGGTSLTSLAGGATAVVGAASKIGGALQSLGKSLGLGGKAPAHPAASKPKSSAASAAPDAVTVAKYVGVVAAMLGAVYIIANGAS